MSVVGVQLLLWPKKEEWAHLQVIEEESGIGQVEDHLLHPQAQGHGLGGVLKDTDTVLHSPPSKRTQWRFDPAQVKRRLPSWRILSARADRNRFWDWDNSGFGFGTLLTWRVWICVPTRRLLSALLLCKLIINRFSGRGRCEHLSDKQSGWQLFSSLVLFCTLGLHVSSLPHITFSRRP